MADLRDGYAELSEVRLHYVQAGDGPLVILLHGFPEFWYSWRHQIQALAAAGFRVVAPDMRGYNLSSRPHPVAAYRSDRLAADVRELIRERGARSARLAGHDWGAAVAWVTAMNHPDAVQRLAMINYYRAAFRQAPWRAQSRIRPIATPTLVIFGERDRYLRHQLAEPHPCDVPNLQRVVRLPEASHWVQNDQPERVNELLIDFFGSA